MKGSEKILVALLSFKRTAGVAILVLVALAIPVTLALNERSQSQQQQASFEPSPTPSALNQTPYFNVDVNSDGQINTADYDLILKCFNGNPCSFQAIDLTSDGIINNADYQIILGKYFQAQQ